MADTGFLFPGTGANRPIDSNDDWGVPSRITADNGLTASVQLLTVGESSDGLAASNFDFSSIPTGATIDGIEIRVGDYTAALEDLAWDVCKLILADDTDGSENKSSELLDWTTSNQTDEAGGSSDLWGENITRANVTDVDWGFFVVAKNISGVPTALVDFLQMKVYHTTISITDVDGDETWDDGDTGLVITGTGFV